MVRTKTSPICFFPNELEVVDAAVKLCELNNLLDLSALGKSKRHTFMKHYILEVSNEIIRQYSPEPYRAGDRTEKGGSEANSKPSVTTSYDVDGISEREDTEPSDEGEDDTTEEQ